MANLPAPLQIFGRLAWDAANELTRAQVLKAGMPVNVFSDGLIANGKALKTQLATQDGNAIADPTVFWMVANTINQIQSKLNTQEAEGPAFRDPDWFGNIKEAAIAKRAEINTLFTKAKAAVEDAQKVLPPPGGQAKPPSGQATPGGQAKPPSGQATPGGQAKPPSGQATPGGQAKPPSGQATPGGQAKPPSGQATPGGQAKPPSGQATPGGQAKPPSGQATPGGQAKPPSGQETPGGQAKASASFGLATLLFGGIAVYAVGKSLKWF